MTDVLGTTIGTRAGSKPYPLCAKLFDKRQTDISGQKWLCLRLIDRCGNLSRSPIAAVYVGVREPSTALHSYTVRSCVSTRNAIPHSNDSSGETLDR